MLSSTSLNLKNLHFFYLKIADLHTHTQKCTQKIADDCLKSLSGSKKTHEQLCEHTTTLLYEWKLNRHIKYYTSVCIILRLTSFS